MSFGVGIGDVVLVSGLAWKLFKAYKDASEDFKQVSTDLMSLHAVLRETEDYLQEHTDLDTSRINRLHMLCDACKPILDELESLITRYDSLGTQAQRTWDRMRFGLQELADLRSRLISSTTMLSAFNIALINSSTMRIEKRLNKFMMEVQAGLREGSVVTVEDVVETLDSPQTWNELRRELEDVGISAVVVEENRDYIVKWMKEALADGLLDESVPDTESPNRKPSVSSRSMTSNSSSSQTLFGPFSSATDSGYGSNGGSRRPSTITLCAANEDFEQKVQLKRTNSLLPTPEDGEAPNWPLVKPKRRMAVSRLLQRIVVKDTAIIEAASDGNLQKVADLIHVGMDVNAKDRWGWTALSMAAYGGFPAIARLLLDNGANLDNVDVDGDTPIDLAANRGHTDVVVLFDEERALMQLKTLS
ncbi:hypothetical protein BN1708_002587 [Verticillium longisporum]|uniref:Uncharacterized protein n=1 Tax=Verticillium longisporum TaxID=100787 RepID=A0A0G4KU44_VERLO|nr:Ankyrin repeat domain-containing protein 11 like [Verticillium longisporum]CRK13231.1 hypothetical protein BN1708_002587 [Verticillium longisporum]